MIVNDKLKFVFVSMTKCGTQSINTLLTKEFGGQRYTNVKKKIDDNNLDYFKFTVSRNPYERMVSWWWAMCKVDGDRYGHKKELKNAGLSESLFDFLTLWEKKPYYGHTMSSWLILNPPLDKIIKLENIEELNSLPFITTALIIPKINVHKERPSWEELLDNDSHKLINRVYADDFKNFNYEMIT